MNTRQRLLRRRDILGLFCALVVPVRAQRKERLFEVVVVNHINIRASNPTRSAHFYQGLFGGDLLWIESTPPNPASPTAESWFLSLGQHYLSITPTFPDRNLPPGLDHICPAVSGYQSGAAAAKLTERGIDMVAGAAGLADGWIRDPDGMIYQLRDDAGASKPGVPPARAKRKVGDRLAPGSAPFAPVAIRELTLRVADLNKTAEFLTTVFGGEITFSGPRDARIFKFGDCLLRLVPRTVSGASARVGMDRFAIAVKDFSAESARRALRQRGIEPHDNGRPGEVHFADPDGIHLQLLTVGAPR
jgi:catechol 2,3-dioxygenase-like lactoylglutathione lyase family enzyme